MGSCLKTVLKSPSAPNARAILSKDSSEILPVLSNCLITLSLTLGRFLAGFQNLLELS
ncbi:MAG: hypothetical protein WCK42_02980 [Myxococcaceae bacterium]